MNTEKLTPEGYIFKFGKYKNYLAKDVIKITTIDKNNKSVKTGLIYMKWLVDQCDWFKHKEIIQEIINKEEDMGEDADDEAIKKQPNNKPEKQPKQPKQPKEKKNKDAKMKIDITSNKIEFD